MKFGFLSVIQHGSQTHESFITGGCGGALRFRGLEVLGGSNAKESILETDGKIKFFGAIRLSAQSAESVVGAFFSEQCSYILVLPKNFEVRHALDMGWFGDVAEDPSFFNYICENRGLVLKKVGEFDDCGGLQKESKLRLVSLTNCLAESPVTPIMPPVRTSLRREI